MKLKNLTYAGVAALLMQAPLALAADHKVEFKTEEDKVSYTIGVDMGNNFRKQKIDINPEIMAKGIKDGLAGDKTLLTKKQMEDTLLSFQKNLIAKREAALKEQSAENLKIGKAFLAENKKKSGVVTLPSGLQYKIIKKGEGAKPTANDTVTVNYTGYLVDPKSKDGLGDEFDSTPKRNKPATFPVAGVIPGWTEALQLMHPGAQWEIYVPADLAYGENAVGMIGPNQTLIFKIELLSVKKAEDAAASKDDAKKADKPADKKS